MELKEKLNCRVYIEEHGILLPKEDKEYHFYSHVYDKKHAYYDYYQEYNCYDLETRKKEILKHLKNHCQPNEYYIITRQGLLKDYYCSKDYTEETDWEEIKQDLNDCWECPSYSNENIVYSVYKDENGLLVENFVEK